MIKLSEELEEVLEEAMEHFYLCWNRGIKEYLAPAVSNGRLALAIHAALDEIRLLRGERQDKRGDDGISMTEHALRDRVANAIDAGFQRTHFTVLVADAVLDIDEIREALKARASSVALERERDVERGARAMKFTQEELDARIAEAVSDKVAENEALIRDVTRLEARLRGEVAENERLVSELAVSRQEAEKAMARSVLAEESEANMERAACDSGQRLEAAMESNARLRAEVRKLRETVDDYAAMLRSVAHHLRTDPNWLQRIVGLLQKHRGYGSPLRAAHTAAPTEREKR